MPARHSHAPLIGDIGQFGLAENRSTFLRPPSSGSPTSYRKCSTEAPSRSSSRPPSARWPGPCHCHLHHSEGAPLAGRRIIQTEHWQMPQRQKSRVSRRSSSGSWVRLAISACTGTKFNKTVRPNVWEFPIGEQGVKNGDERLVVLNNVANVDH